MAGAANPFRATMFTTAPGAPTGGFGGLSSAPTGGAFATGLNPTPTGLPGFGSNFGGGNAFGFGVPATSPSGQPQQQQNGQASLI
ncbi:hypothetical protein NM688_g867 [Phlebia brevispora]|uniref:Uncharacterized protein n=1 Tax=Phlebia brevispora TaxID=194682 RepID=A0ACC1TD56_9APHY|nr:hypothetical protein NM688_g867 [Phlebia brevispora]